VVGFKIKARYLLVYPHLLSLDLTKLHGYGLRASTCSSCFTQFFFLSLLFVGSTLQSGLHYFHVGY